MRCLNMHSLTCGSVLRTLSAGLASKSKNAALVIDSLCWQSEDAMAFERFSPFAWTTQKNELMFTMYREDD